MPVQVHLSVATDRKGLSRPALRTFLRIADLWELTVDEQMTLLGITEYSTESSHPPDRSDSDTAW